jgi:predicted RNA-binding Zn ribbon-like protein
MSRWPLILAFVNSRLERPAGVEEDMPDPAAAGRWLADRLGGEAAPLGAAEFAAMLQLRDAVRHLIQDRIAGRQPAQGDLAVLNDSSAAACRHDMLTPAWQRDARFGDAAGPGGSSPWVQLAVLASDAIDLLSAPGARIAECAAEDCVVIFERSDPRRRWHSDRCGNRIRAARSYGRRGARLDEAPG